MAANSGGLKSLSVDTAALRGATGPGGLGGVGGQISQLPAKHGLDQDLEFTDPAVTGFAVGIDLDAAYKACVDALVRGPGNSVSQICQHVDGLQTGLTKAADHYDAAHAQHKDALTGFTDSLESA